MTSFAVAVVAITLAAGLAATVGLTRLPTARMQLIAFALLAVLLPLWIVFFSGWAMFHMGDDVKILAVASAAASAAVGVALVIGTSIARRIERLRAASARLAAGDLAARAPETGPRELADLGRAFNEMASSIEGLFDARRELVAAASHDLRTPIASITAMLEAIEDGLADSSEYLGPLRDQARRLASLVEDLFELARIDAGSLAHELREIALGPLVESCVRGFEAEARSRNVRLEQRIEDAPPALCAPEQVERVLLNLLTNALRHTPGDGTVAVTLAAGRRRGPGLGRGHRRGDHAGDGDADVRSLLARRHGPRRRRRRRRPRARDRPRPRRGAGRPDLGGGARERRRPRVVHAPVAD